MDVTRERISHNLELRETLLSIQTGFSLANAAVVCAILESIFHALTIATLSWLVFLSPWSANLESPKLCSPSCSLCTFTCSHHSSALTSSLVACQCLNFLLKKLTASVSMPSPPPPLFISLTFYICTLLLGLFTPVLTPTSSKFYSISARQKVIVLSLTLVFLSGTHCCCTLEML